jgi:hypothetical protein
MQLPHKVPMWLTHACHMHMSMYMRMTACIITRMLTEVSICAGVDNMERLLTESEETSGPGRSADSVVKLFPCSLLQRHRQGEGCPSGDCLIVACSAQTHTHTHTYTHNKSSSTVNHK